MPAPLALLLALLMTTLLVALPRRSTEPRPPSAQRTLQPSLQKLFAHGTTRFYNRANHKEAPGESVRVHAPFCLGVVNSSATAYVPAKQVVNCTDFAQHKRISRTTCKQLMHKQAKNELSYHSLRHLSSLPSANERPVLRAGSALLMHFSILEMNICHLAMRLYLAWAVANRPEAFGIAQKAITELILIVPERPVRRLLATRIGHRHGLHGGLVHALFSSRGINVTVSDSMATHVNETGDVCYDSAAIVGSFGNRFALPDDELPSRVTHGLQKPLSSQALAMRETVLGGRMFGGVPHMGRKLGYIARRPFDTRSWDAASERVFRAMLTRVAERAGARLVVHEGAGEPASFDEQVGVVADAAVIVGFHGAGLSLAAFAPAGAGMVEIWPRGFELGLFGSLRSAGLEHVTFRLREGSSPMEGFPGGVSVVRAERMSMLLQGDEREIERLLGRMLDRRRWGGRGVWRPAGL